MLQLSPSLSTKVPPLGSFVTDMRPIYFDYNATTPLDPRVLEAMLP